MMQKNGEMKLWHMGTHLRELGESYPMHTNMAGLKLFLEKWVIVLWKKVTLALEGFREQNCLGTQTDRL